MAMAEAQVVDREVKRMKPQVKNRRMVRMQQLVEEGEFFSLWNMQDRAPLLYHEHVGKYEEDPECSGTTLVSEDSGPNTSLRCEMRGEARGNSCNAPPCLTPGEWRDNKQVSKVFSHFRVRFLVLVRSLMLDFFLRVKRHWRTCCFKAWIGKM